MSNHTSYLLLGAVSFSSVSYKKFRKPYMPVHKQLVTGCYVVLLAIRNLV